MDKSPDAFRTISEVAEQLDTPAHVLRFWESRFPQIRPVKRAGGRRYYRPSDVALLAGIKRLLHDDGVTIRGVQKILREQGVRHVAGLGGMAPLPQAEAEIEAVLAAAFSPPPEVPVDAAAVKTAQVISLEAALARVEGRAQQLPLEFPADPVEDAPEAPFVEAEEEPLPDPVPLHVETAAQSSATPDSDAGHGADGDDSGQGVESLAESTVAMRLRRVEPAAMADHHAALVALRDRMNDLQARLAKGVRRRAR